MPFWRSRRGKSGRISAGFMTDAEICPIVFEKSVEVVDFPELGMEAVRKIYVENFPAFLLVDDKGNDFFAEFKK